MKKNIAVFMIVNMIMVIFTVVNIQPVYAEQKTCCVMENACSLMNSADCSAVPGRDSGVISCNSVPECNTGCCVTANSCDDGRTKTYCNQNGGSWNSGDCSGKSECAKGVCIINGICYDDYSKRQCDAAGLGAKFDASLQDCGSANALLSGSEGCCITGNSFVRTTSSACNGGRFVSGYLCSSAVSGSSCLPRDHKTCFNGKVYWVDSCGNRENVADNLAEHTAYNQANSRILSDSVLKSNTGYCKIEDGKSCGVDNKGNVACLDMNCDLGESFYTETNFDPEIAMFLDTKSIKIDQNFLGETSEQQKGNRRLLYDQFAPSKENTKIRKDGESWCMLWPQPEYNSGRKEANSASPGSRDYVFRCIRGKIEIEPCADYRSEVCSEGYDQTRDITTARCGDNKWEGCIGASQSGCNDQNKLCRYVQGECVPLVPPGNVFWDGDFSNGNEYKCEKCGGGFQTCDERSCVRLGDCRITKISIWSRLGKIALLAGIVVVTMASFGIGFGYSATLTTTAPATIEGASVPVGTIFTPLATGGYTATLATGQIVTAAGAELTMAAGATATATGFLAAVPGISHIAAASYWAGDHIGLTKIFGVSSAAKGATSKAQASNTPPRLDPFVAEAQGYGNGPDSGLNSRGDLPATIKREAISTGTQIAVNEGIKVATGGGPSSGGGAPTVENPAVDNGVKGFQGECNPSTCTSLGKTCDTWSDGCGAVIYCGSCDTGSTCQSGSCVKTSVGITPSAGSCNNVFRYKETDTANGQYTIYSTKNIDGKCLENQKVNVCYAKISLGSILDLSYGGCDNICNQYGLCDKLV